MTKKYVVRLTAEERTLLEQMVKKGKSQAYRIKHANILLAVDADGPAWSDGDTAQALRCHRGTVCNVRQRFVGQGLERALERKEQQRPSRERMLDGEKEARLIAIACSKAPEGRAKWTLNLLAEQLVVLDVVESVSRSTVWRTLKKTNSSPICESAG
ncbi:MAG: transposase [Candidatus Hydrogenedentota bacterium]